MTGTGLEYIAIFERTLKPKINKKRGFHFALDLTVLSLIKKERQPTM